MSRRIYVASLSDYNNGDHVGVWIDCDGKSAEDLQEEVNAMLKTSEQEVAEEYAIHDHEGFGDGNIVEYTSLREVAELTELLEKHGDAYLAYIEHVGRKYASESDFEERYEGAFDSKEAWGDNWADGTGMLDSIPENLRGYFDMERWVRDCELGGDIDFVEYDDELYAFRGN